MPEDRHARLRRPHVMAGPDDEARAEVRFERADPLRNAGRRNVELAGGFGH